MAYSSQAAQKNKRSFLDPRVKIVLVLLLAIFVMGGVGGARMKDISFVLSIIPFVLLLIEQQWKKYICHEPLLCQCQLCLECFQRLRQNGNQFVALWICVTFI